MAQEVTADAGARPVLKQYYLDLKPEKPMDLTAKERKEIPKKDFAFSAKKTKENPSGKGAYPIEDEAHARDALSRVAANGTEDEKKEVREKVEKKYPGMDVAGKKNEKKKMGDWLKEPPRARRARKAKEQKESE